MKVAVVANINNPIKRPFLGGMESFVFNLVAGYRALGHEVAVYCHSASDPELNIVKLPRCVLLEGDSSHSAHDCYYLAAMDHIVNSNFDLIHNNALSAVPILARGRYKSRLPLMITTLHTPPYVQQVAALRSTGECQRSMIVAPSSHLRNRWHGLVSVPISVVPNGIPIEQWKVASTGSTSAVWTGRLVQKKGVDLAIKAAKNAGIKIRIAGPIGDRSYYEDVILPTLTDGASYEGHLDHAGLRDLYSDSRLSIVVPRWEEPFGLTTVESMATGTPPIGFDRGAFAEIVCKESGVVCDRRFSISPSEIQRASQLLAGPVVRRARRFSLRAMTEGYCKLAEHRA